MVTKVEIFKFNFHNPNLNPYSKINMGMMDIRYFIRIRIEQRISLVMLSTYYLD
jgi:hypothetical protein